MLTDLPLEILIMIFSFVDSKNDLEALFRTNCTMRALRTNELFKKLWIFHSYRIDLSIKYGYHDIFLKLYDVGVILRDARKARDILRWASEYNRIMVIKRIIKDVLDADEQVLPYETSNENFLIYLILSGGALISACQRGHMEIVSALLLPGVQFSDEVITSCFIQSFTLSHFNIMDVFEEKGIPIKIHLGDARSIFMHFILMGNTRAFWMFRSMIMMAGMYNAIFQEQNNPALVTWNIGALIHSLKKNTVDVAHELITMITVIPRNTIESLLAPEILRLDNVDILVHLYEKNQHTDELNSIFSKAYLLKKWNIFEFYVRHMLSIIDCRYYLEYSIVCSSFQAFSIIFNVRFLPLVRNNAMNSREFCILLLNISICHDQFEVSELLCEHLTVHEISQCICIAIQMNRPRVLRLFMEKGARMMHSRVPVYSSMIMRYASEETNAILREFS